MDSGSSSDENSVKKGPWTLEEDEKLMDYIRKHGCGSWRSLPERAGLNRCGKSCRLRWTNYLRPDIKRGNFSQEEERTIIKLHRLLGNKWSKIATHLPGRTDNEIKNYWNTQIRKRFLQMGIDPVTHQPRTDHHLNHLLNLSQLLRLQQFNNLMNNNNPLETALKLQADAVQIAQAQLLQNLLQIINCTNLSGSNSNFLGSQNPNYFQLEGLISGISATGQDFLSSGTNPQACGNSSSSLGGLMFDNSFIDGNHVDYNPSLSHSFDGQTSAGGQLPGLVSVSPETSTANQSTERKRDDDPSFDAWEKLMDDDETSCSYWKDLLDLTWSPSSS